MVGLDERTKVEILKEMEFYGLRKLLLSQLTFHSFQHTDEIESLIQVNDTPYQHTQQDISQPSD